MCRCQTLTQRYPLLMRQLELGCKGLVVPSMCPANHSPSHRGFDALWATAEEAGIPILFHVGGEEKMSMAYTENGAKRSKTSMGGMRTLLGSATWRFRSLFGKR